MERHADVEHHVLSSISRLASTGRADTSITDCQNEVGALMIGLRKSQRLGGRRKITPYDFLPASYHCTRCPSSFTWASARRTSSRARPLPVSAQRCRQRCISITCSAVARSTLAASIAALRTESCGAVTAMRASRTAGYVPTTNLLNLDRIDVCGCCALRGKVTHRNCWQACG